MGRNGSARSVPPGPAVIGLRMAGTVHPRILEEKGVPYGKGLPTRSAAHPRGQGDRRGNHAGPRRADADRTRGAGRRTRRNPSDPGFRPMPGKPATATRTRRKTQRTVTTPLQRPVRRNPTPVYCPRRRGRRISAETNPATSIRAGKGRVRPVRRANAAQRDLLSEPRRVRGKVRGQRVLLPPEREREHAMGERLVALSGARVPARRHVARYETRARHPAR